MIVQISRYSIRYGLYAIGLLVSITIVGASSLTTFRYKGAGVLPLYAYNNELQVVLAREAHGRDKGTYDSFGGSRDSHEHNPIITGGREFAEEAISQKTIGLSAFAVAQYIDPYKNKNTSFVAVSKRTEYVLFFTRFDQYMNRFINTFYTTLRSTKHFKHQEKDRIARVPWNALSNAIRGNKNNSTVTVSATIIDPRGQRFNHQEQIRLRPILVKMLRPYFENHHSEGDARNPKTIRYYV